MKTILTSGRAALVVLLCTLAASAPAQPFQLISTIDPSRLPAAGGSGDSGAPVISADGRYVVFASTADNLVLSTNNTPIPVRIPACLNVFVRDRTSGTTTLVSVNLTGREGGNEDSVPLDISTNGQSVLFESSASDLASGDTNKASDVFVRDLVNGTTILVSANTNGVAGNGASRSAVMTPDARYVAFVSEASDLAPGDTNGIPDVFVRDLQTGTTVLASVGATARGVGTSSECPEITPDGRYVVFHSSAANLTAGAINSSDIYVRDLAGGTTTWVSADARAAVEAVLHSSTLLCFNHAMSADGRVVAYEAGPPPGVSSVAGLVFRYSLNSGVTDVLHTNVTSAPAGRDEVRSLDMTPDGQRIAFVAITNGASGTTTCILLWDAATGACELVSGNLTNGVVANTACDWPALDASGRFVVFSSTAPNLVTNALAGACHLYLRDTLAGSTTLLDADTNRVGVPVDSAVFPRLSADGRFVAFECGDSRLVPQDCNHNTDVFVQDVARGVTELISARDPALASSSPNESSQLTSYSVSADGGCIAFASDADNLVANDTNGCRDIFVRDLANNTNLLVSAAVGGLSGNGPSFGPAVSADGRYVAFTSRATNLVTGDLNGMLDVCVRDLQTGTTSLVSVNSTGTGPGNKDSYSPVISSNGRYVLFRSLASNLAAGAFSNENLFFRDLQASTTWALTLSGCLFSSMTPDGRFILYVDGATSTSKLYVWASASATKVYTNITAGLYAAAISPNGNRLAYWAGSGNLQLRAVDRVSNTSVTIGAASPASPRVLRFSGDSRFLAYTAPVNKTNQVYLYDCQTGNNLLVSQSCNSAVPALGASDSPEVSADGRLVVYRSAAADLVPGDANGVPDIFLYDRQSSTTMLLSGSRFGNVAAANRSLCPVFSADGQTLVFQSWAADLGAMDFNRGCDVFAYGLSFSGTIPVIHLTLVPSGSPGGGPWITWPAAAGKTYRVEFKNSLSESTWQNLGGTVEIIGSQGYSRDFAPAATQRFYRVVAD